MESDALLQSVFTPLRAATTFEETVERLGTAIRTGILPAGSRLPAERMLADELGISRSTLRQALTTLVQSGHLISLRGRGGEVLHRALLGGLAAGVEQWWSPSRSAFPSPALHRDPGRG